ncbi:U11/U12 small nuclear ribonucleoprotein 35 kDa protein-like [Antedon mediterranea]|uniref:U11/U12 small nuclear ribonucleoprotein 35 kDa protein-like n=1 Tax=Antedon mediterranea TaxID=105859 RepID=UPI003AF8CF7C
MESKWTAIAVVYDPLKAGSIDGTDDRAHDRAVERALKARYNPDKTLDSSAECSIFVGRLNLNTTEETLNTLFQKYGEIKRLRLVRDIVTGFSKGYAFIEYIDERDAYRAIDEANYIYIDGNEIYVDKEIARTLEGWIPRRLGGGFGGKKESGQLRFGGKDRPFKKPIVLSQKREEEHKYGRRDRYGVDRRERQRSRERDREERDKKLDRDRERYKDRGEKYRDRGERDRDKGERDRDRGDRNRDRGDRNRDRGDRNRDREDRNRDKGERDRDKGERDSYRKDRNRDRHGEK